jgi:hypothetical protein
MESGGLSGSGRAILVATAESTLRTLVSSQTGHITSFLRACSLKEALLLNQPSKRCPFAHSRSNTIKKASPSAFQLEQDSYFSA